MSEEKDLPIKIQEEDEIEGVSFEELEENFKTLASELKSGEITVDHFINAEEDESQDEENAMDAPKTPQYRDYSPGVLDFLARARTVEECEEIIEYCLMQKEISEEQVIELRKHIAENGPTSFGNRKPGHYDKPLDSH